MTTLRQAAEQALSQLINLQPVLGNGLLNRHQLAFIDPHIDMTITALRQALEAEQHDEPVAFEFYNPATGHAIVDYSEHTHLGCLSRAMGYIARPLYTSPQPAQQPLSVREEVAAFKAWFEAWWMGDGEVVQAIPAQGDPFYDDYVNQYTLGFGAWMAAKHHKDQK